MQDLIQKTKEVGEDFPQNLSFAPRLDVRKHGFLRHDSGMLDAAQHVNTD